MTLRLVERDFASFFQVPFEVYPPSLPYASMLKGDLKATLDPKKNPHWQAAEGTYFTALNDGRPVGRIVCHIHRAANERFKEKAASFGWFDAADDVEVARALLTKAEEFGRARGMTLLRGNMNLTANQEIGVLAQGEAEDPFLAQMFGAPHMGSLLERCGFTKALPMSTFVKRDVQQTDPEACLSPRQQKLLGDTSFTWREFRMDRFDEDVEHVRDLLNDSMSENTLFVPMTVDEAKFQLGPLKDVMDPKLVRIAEHDGRVVAATLCTPDVNPLLRAMKSRLNPWTAVQFLLGRRRLKRAVVIIFLVRRAYHGRGIIGVLNRDLLRALKAGGYTDLGITWISDTNKGSLRQVELLGCKPQHRLFLYEKAL
jgi:GNAT superfamily N-acetyltransferase